MIYTTFYFIYRNIKLNNSVKIYSEKIYYQNKNKILNILNTYLL